MTVLATARLSLRPLTKASPRQVAWLRDPDVVKYSEQRHLEHTLSSQLRYVMSFAGKSRLWGIYYVEAGGEHIGTLSARHDDANNVTEIGILIGAQEFWGKGLGGEAWRSASAWLLDPGGGNSRKLEAGCMRSNVAMMKILKSNGFTEEGERKNHFLLEGSPVSAVLFGRMR